jgi:hypothetical protein
MSFSHVHRSHVRFEAIKDDDDTFSIDERDASSSVGLDSSPGRAPVNLNLPPNASMNSWQFSEEDDPDPSYNPTSRRSDEEKAIEVLYYMAQK